MSDEINQEKSVTLYCAHPWPKNWDLWCKYQISRQNIKNAGLGKKKTTVKGQEKEYNCV